MDQKSEQPIEKKLTITRREFLRKSAKGGLAFTALNLLGPLATKGTHAQVSSKESTQKQEIIPLSLTEVSNKEFFKRVHNESLTIKKRDVIMESKDDERVPFITPDGSKVIYTTYDRKGNCSIISVNFQDITKRTIIPLNSAVNGPIDSNQDGSKIIFVASDDVIKKLCLIDTLKKKITHIKAPHGLNKIFNNLGLLMSPDDQKVTFVMDDGKKTVICYGDAFNLKAIFEITDSRVPLNSDITGSVAVFEYGDNIYFWSKNTNNVTQLTSYQRITNHYPRFPHCFSTDVVGYTYYTYRGDSDDDLVRIHIMNINNPQQMWELQFPDFQKTTIPEAHHPTLENGFLLHYIGRENSREVSGTLIVDIYERIFTVLSKTSGRFPGSISMDGRKIVVPTSGEEAIFFELVSPNKEKSPGR